VGWRDFDGIEIFVIGEDDLEIRFDENRWDPVRTMVLKRQWLPEMHFSKLGIFTGPGLKGNIWKSQNSWSKSWWSEVAFPAPVIKHGWKIPPVTLW
jgi:hypothetical protein